MDTILIIGGTGLIGRHLIKKLKSKGYRVAILSRNPEPIAYIKAYRWDINKGEIENEAIESADYIIHLAGANIGSKRWTAQRKQLIIDSRVKTAALLYERTKSVKNKVKAYISASAIGYYGAITSEKIYSEEDIPANDFLGLTCRLWEQSADWFGELKIRVVKIRTGIVLTKQDGALSKMIWPFKMGIGSAIASGQQYMPWIHIDDLCEIYIKAIEDDQLVGPYNAVAPEHITNYDFSLTIAGVLNKPIRVPKVPALALKIIYGKMSEMLLEGSRVSSEKIIKAGYHFKFANLQSALKDVLENSSK